MAWGIVFYQRSYHTIKEITKKNWLFLFSSGITTGLSWICYYKALQLGEASIVVPIDKLSIIVTNYLFVFCFKRVFVKKGCGGIDFDRCRNNVIIDLKGGNYERISFN